MKKASPTRPMSCGLAFLLSSSPFLQLQTANQIALREIRDMYKKV
ncbi:hypothetical protein ACU063_19300 [Paenibacillus sp. M.A.Huq-81]